MDAEHGVLAAPIKIKRPRPQGVFDAAIHVARQIGTAPQHLRGRRPAGPGGLAAHMGDAAPFKAPTPHANAIGHGLTPAHRQVEPARARIDGDRACGLPGGIRHQLARSAGAGGARFVIAGAIALIGLGPEARRPHLGLPPVRIAGIAVKIRRQDRTTGGGVIGDAQERPGELRGGGRIAKGQTAKDCGDMQGAVGEGLEGHDGALFRREMRLSSCVPKTSSEEERLRLDGSWRLRHEG